MAAAKGKTTSDFSDDQLWTANDLMRLGIASNRVHIFRLRRDQQFPSPIKYGSSQNAPVRWRASEVRAWLDKIGNSRPTSTAAE
jgi:predicted DNA-binding transcriptional regulator AlpA